LIYEIDDLAEKPLSSVGNPRSEYFNCATRRGTYGSSHDVACLAGYGLAGLAEGI